MSHGGLTRARSWKWRIQPKEAYSSPGLLLGNLQWPDFDSYSFFCFLKSSSIIAGGAEIDPCATTIQVSLSTFKQQNSQGTGGKLSGGPLRESSAAHFSQSSSGPRNGDTYI